MTVIKYREDPVTRILTFDACGHAGSAPAGRNLVCAAVTTLVLMLAEYADKNGGTAVVEPGEAHISLEAVTATKYERTREVFRAVADAALGLADAWPEELSSWRPRRFR